MERKKKIEVKLEKVQVAADVVQVKYLGSCPVPSDTGEEVTATAVKAILAAAKGTEKKLARVEVTKNITSPLLR